MSNDNINATMNEAPKPGTKAYVEAELAAAKAELEALKAQAAESSAPNAELVAPIVLAEEREEIFVPKGYANDEPNLLISVNGVNYLLPRGKTSNVPKFIADEFHRSQKAQEALDKRVDEMLEASK